MNISEQPEFAELVRRATIAAKTMPELLPEAQRAEDFKSDPKGVYSGIVRAVRRLNDQISSNVFHVSPSETEIDALIAESRHGWIGVHVYFQPLDAKSREQAAFFQVATNKTQDHYSDTREQIPGSFSYDGITRADPKAIEDIILEGMEGITRKLVRQNADRALRPDIYGKTEADGVSKE